VLEIATGSGVEVVSAWVWRGRYENEGYGFSIEIPMGLFGSNAPAPAPNTGFTIAFDEESEVWVDASYEDTASPHQFARYNARLGNLKAERKSWSDTSNGIRLFHDSITARGSYRGKRVIYTIQMDATSEHRSEALRALEALRSSFHNLPIRSR
jgi:hypothetical protein